MTLNAGEQRAPAGVVDPDGRQVVVVDSGGVGSGTAGYPTGSAPATSSSGNKANANAVATLAAAAGQTTYISGFEATASGATAGLPVSLTVVGVAGGTMTYTFTAPAGVLVAAAPLQVQFRPPIPGSAVNTAIVVTLPALGSGNTNAAVVAHGFQL